MASADRATRLAPLPTESAFDLSASVLVVAAVAVLAVAAAVRVGCALAVVDYALAIAEYAHSRVVIPAAMRI